MHCIGLLINMAVVRVANRMTLCKRIETRRRQIFTQSKSLACVCWAFVVPRPSGVSAFIPRAPRVLSPTELVMQTLCFLLYLKSNQDSFSCCDNAFVKTPPKGSWGGWFAPLQQTKYRWLEHACTDFTPLSVGGCLGTQGAAQCQIPAAAQVCGGPPPLPGCCRPATPHCTIQGCFASHGCSL